MIRAALAVALLTVSATALAHGEFDWIMQGDYRGKDNIHCCGERDCDYIEDADITLTRAGYVLRYKGKDYLFDEWARGLHVTERADKPPIMCRRLHDDTPRCIFVKPLGS
jgi:hypothetical protein